MNKILASLIASAFLLTGSAMAATSTKPAGKTVVTASAKKATPAKKTAAKKAKPAKKPAAKPAAKKTKNPAPKSK
jgi:hypothetical protein